MRARADPRTDLVTTRLPLASRDAVVAAYVMGHVPIADRPPLFERIASWLRPGGWLCASFPSGDDPGESIDDDWLGAPMFFASESWARESSLIEDAGFCIDAATVRTDDEEGVPVSFRWVFARRTTAALMRR